MFDPHHDYRCTLAKQAFQARWRPEAPQTYARLHGVVDARAMRKILDRIEPDAPLHIDIDSGGGDPLVALAIYRVLREHPAKITTETRTSCHSAALVVFMAGDERLAPPAARFLMHFVACEPVGWTAAAALRALAGELDQIDHSIVDLICMRTGCSGWQVRADMTNEYTFNAQWAYQRGIVTRLLAA